MLSRALNIYMYIASPVSKGMEDSSSKPVKVDKGSIFGHLNPSQHEAGDIFNMMATFNTDRSPNKVNLGIGGKYIGLSGPAISNCVSIRASYKNMIRCSLALTSGSCVVLWLTFICLHYYSSLATSLTI